MIDSEKMHFIIPGNPIPKARPRFGRFKVYDPQGDVKHECKCAFRKQMLQNGIEMVKNRLLIVDLELYTCIPNKAPKRISNAISMNEQQGIRTYHGKRPDIDNYIKFYLDAMNEVVYYDDGCICRVPAEKFYSTNPRTEITINVFQDSDIL